MSYVVVECLKIGDEDRASVKGWKGLDLVAEGATNFADVDLGR